MLYDIPGIYIFYDRNYIPAGILGVILDILDIDIVHCYIQVTVPYIYTMVNVTSRPVFDVDLKNSIDVRNTSY